MKQLVQNNQSGEIELAEIPRPIPKTNEILVRNLASAVSSGTERGNMDFAKASLLTKARRRPDLVRKVVNKARQEGVAQAYREARARLDLPFPLGYSSAGVVVDTGPGASLFPPGTLVACSGAHCATHGEWITLPESMAAEIPDGVSPEEASFSTLGAIVIHGMRIGEAALGSNIAFIGLGLLGLLGVQIAKAGGMRVCALDISGQRVAKARELGADLAIESGETAVDAVQAWAGDTGGADTVIISATSQTNDPLILAAEIARERGTLVLLGNFPPDLPRRYGYDKELSLRFTRAWGPGTYDPAYQERGHEEGYPPSLVRWSARRNMAAYLDLVAAGGVSVEPLVSHRFAIDDAVEAYGTLSDSAALAISISYPEAHDSHTHGTSGDSTDSLHARDEVDNEVGSKVSGGPRAAVVAPPEHSRSGAARIGVIGAGNYATTQLLPTLNRTEGVELRGLSSASGLKSWFAAKKYGFGYPASDAETIIDDAEIDGVIVATRHNLHAPLAAAALRAGKDVWVEKPLALTFDELEEVESAVASTGRSVIVGFNRRYSPLTTKARSVLAKSAGPLQVSMTINPGALEPGHWVLDPAEGGGRLLSEGCHFFDLANYLIGKAPVGVEVKRVGGTEPATEGFVALVDYEDGSVAHIGYSGAGPRGFGRERIVAIGTGVAIAIENFRTLTTTTGLRTARKRHMTLQKGFDELAAQYIELVQLGGGAAETRQSLVSSALTLSAEESLRHGRAVALTPTGYPASY